MKPFNLQAALSGKAVKLRDGGKAYVRHHETELPVNKHSRLTGFLANGNQLTWGESGSYYGEDKPSDYDIIGMYPKTRVINGFEVPAPESKEPEYGVPYYVASPSCGQFYTYESWDDYALDKLWLERGLVFLSEEDAIANAKAMMGIDPNIGEEE